MFALCNMRFNLLTAGQVSESRLKEIQDEMSKEQQRVEGLTNKYVAQMREKNVSTKYCTAKQPHRSTSTVAVKQPDCSTILKEKQAI